MVKTLRNDCLAPLSFQQEELVQRIRMVPKYAPTLDLLHIFRLEGSIDVPCLTRAVDDLARRHSSLRTTLASVNGSELVQRVHETTEPVPIQPGSTFCEVMTAIKIAHDKSGILEERTLFRHRIHTVGATTILLSFSIHHLVHDGWSYLVLCRDLSEFYASRLEKRPPKLPLLSLTYGDFARSQKKAWTHLMPRAVPFWKRALAGHSGRISWPTSTRGRASRAIRSKTCRFSLHPSAVISLRAAAQTARVPPFLVLLSATVVGVSRVTGQRDFLVGSNTANREDPSKHDVVGYFTNTRMTRAFVKDGSPFLDLVLSIREQWLYSDEHFRDVHVAPLLRAIGEPELLKISMLDFPGLSGQTMPGFFAGIPVLPEAQVTRIPLIDDVICWRDFEFTWMPAADRGFCGEIRHGPRISVPMAAQIAREIAAVLRSPQRAIRI